MEFDYAKLFAAIDEIHVQAQKAKKEEPDDFDYGIIQQLDGCAQRALYHLTRGDQGTRSDLQLAVIPIPLGVSLRSRQNERRRSHEG